MEVGNSIVSCPSCQGKTRVTLAHNGVVRCMRCAHQFKVEEGQITKSNITKMDSGANVTTNQNFETTQSHKKIINGISILLTFWSFILITLLITILISNIPVSEDDNDGDDSDVSTDLDQSEESEYEELWIALGYLTVLAPAIIHVYALSLISTGLKEIFYSIDED
jgi:ribosomal protein L37AE/L43A